MEILQAYFWHFWKKRAVLKKLGKQLIKEAKRDIRFYHKNTELLGFWTLLAGIFIGAFFYGIQSSLLVQLLLVILCLLVATLVSMISMFYLYKVTYGGEKDILVRSHKIFNKSYKVRSGIAFLLKKFVAPALRWIYKRSLLYKLVPVIVATGLKLANPLVSLFAFSLKNLRTVSRSRIKFSSLLH